MSTQFVPTAGGPRVAGLLNLALGQAIAYLDGEVAPHHPDLRPAHLQVFRSGSIDGWRPTALAARAGMTKQAMHELVTHLERHGYLRREVDPADERARRVRVTERGAELERQVVAASARLHLRWRDQLGEELFTALWTALRELTGQDADPPDPADLSRRAAQR